MNTLNINVENLTLEERKQAFDLFEKSQTKKPLRFEPKKYQSYYSVLEAGDIEESQWDNDYIDEKRTQHGNVFRKKKTAEQAANKHRAVNKIAAFVEQFDDGWEADWQNRGQTKNFICFTPITKEYEILCTTVTRDPARIYMSYACAIALREALNSGEYEL